MSSRRISHSKQTNPPKEQSPANTIDLTLDEDDGSTRSSSTTSKSNKRTSRPRNEDFSLVWSLAQRPTSKLPTTPTKAAQARLNNPLRSESDSQVPQIPLKSSRISKRASKSTSALADDKVDLTNVDPMDIDTSALADPFVGNHIDIEAGGASSEDELDQGPPEGPAAFRARSPLVQSDSLSDSSTAIYDQENAIVQPVTRASHPSTPYNQSPSDQPTSPLSSICVDPQSPHQIDENLRERLRKKLTLNQDSEYGDVYILWSPSNPSLLKIGFSKNRGRRLKQLRKICKLPDLTDISITANITRRSFQHARVVESLVHIELHNLKAKAPCACTTSHCEWFEMTPELAIRTVRRWTDFIQKRPFDADGRLKNFYCERLKGLPQPLSNERADSFDVRHKRWQAVLSASDQEYYSYQVKTYLHTPLLEGKTTRVQCIWRLRWLIICLIEGWFTSACPEWYFRSVFWLLLAAVVDVALVV